MEDENLLCDEGFWFIVWWKKDEWWMMNDGNYCVMEIYCMMKDWTNLLHAEWFIDDWASGLFLIIDCVHFLIANASDC